MNTISKLGPLTRIRYIGTRSDGSDVTPIEETYWVVTYRDDDISVATAEFKHDPTQAELDALAPRRATASTAVQAAVSQWNTSQTTWNNAVAMPQSTTAEALAKILAGENALHQEHIALMRALRAMALLERLDDMA